MHTTSYEKIPKMVCRKQASGDIKKTRTSHDLRQGLPREKCAQAKLAIWSRMLSKAMHSACLK